jgi:hypothetical protein
LAIDMAAYLRQQPEVRATMLFPELDPMNEGHQLQLRIRELLGKIATNEGQSVTALQLASMSHGYHAYYPAIAESIKAKYLY